MTLTSDELFNLAELAWQQASRNIDDEEYYNEYVALSKKLITTAKALQGKETP